MLKTVFFPAPDIFVILLPDPAYIPIYLPLLPQVTPSHTELTLRLYVPAQKWASQFLLVDRAFIAAIISALSSLPLNTISALFLSSVHESLAANVSLLEFEIGLHFSHAEPVYPLLYITLIDPSGIYIWYGVPTEKSTYNVPQSATGELVHPATAMWYTPVVCKVLK